MILIYVLLSLTAISFITFWVGIIIKRRRMWIASLVAFLFLVFVDIALTTMTVGTGVVHNTEINSN